MVSMCDAYAELYTFRFREPVVGVIGTTYKQLACVQHVLNICCTYLTMEMMAIKISKIGIGTTITSALHMVNWWTASAYASCSIAVANSSTSPPMGPRLQASAMHMRRIWEAYPGSRTYAAARHPPERTKLIKALLSISSAYAWHLPFQNILRAASRFFLDGCVMTRGVGNCVW